MQAKPVARFEKRQQKILEASSLLLNQHGAQGFRRDDVAKMLKLDPSSIAYYFKKRDDLLAACLEQTVIWIEDHTELAVAAPGQQKRTEIYLKANLQLLADQRLGRTVPLPILSDLMTLSDPHRKELDARLAKAFYTISSFDDPIPGQRLQPRQRLFGNILLNIIFWMPAWDERFRVSDFLNLEPSMQAFLADGILTEAYEPSTDMVSLEPHHEDSARRDYLNAATRLVNELGYKGARVDLIAADLGLSTGSFYHHLKTKDELIMAAFERTFNIVEAAFELSENAASPGQRVATICHLLTHHQLTAETPLLRTSSYQALPLELRTEALKRTDQLVQYLSDIIVDGIADGSIRKTNPVMAANCLFAMVTGLSPASRLIQRTNTSDTHAMFMSTLTRGVYALRQRD